MVEGKYGLVTRSDMDGLVCALLLKKLDLIDSITFVHPKDVQDGSVLLTKGHITTNLPYNTSVHMAFDHHSSEVQRVGPRPNLINNPNAPSAARVVYEYFGGKKGFPSVSDEMMAAVDKADSAQFTLEEILNPQGWVLLSYLMDARTGLGRFKNFTVSNYQLMMALIDYCQFHSIEQILDLPDVKERIELFLSHQEKSKEQISRCTRVHGSLAVLDLRQEEIIYSSNRFMIYALNPDCAISMHVMWGVRKQNTVFAVGKSILNRTSALDIGKLMLEYGGGGHENAGTCQVDNDKADAIKLELIDKMSH